MAKWIESTWLLLAAAGLILAGLEIKYDNEAETKDRQQRRQPVDASDAEICFEKKN